MADRNGVEANAPLLRAFKHIANLPDTTAYGQERDSEVDSLRAEVKALAERVERLEKANRLASFHIGQFVKVNMPSYRPILGVGAGFTPSHIVAALYHLERGSQPNQEEVAEAVGKEGKP